MIQFEGKDRTVLAWIPARGGSKGVPRKALRNLGGKPIIAYTIEAALEITGVDKVLVNTDDEEIREVSLKFGAEVPFLRPQELAQDDSNLGHVVHHMNVWLEEHENFRSDIGIGMSPTYPFRKRHRINDAIALAYADRTVGNVRSVIRSKIHGENYWTQHNGLVEPFLFNKMECNPRADRFINLFAFNIIFNYRYHAYSDCRFSMPDPYEITTMEAIDIDTIEDFTLARIIAERGLFSYE
ncbi:cytidylyltransferase domain-containing protein [Desulfovibrio inopinatus]|uniref:acylneuraminate cytidylyltransferase family protein n=1 Tax=Desulfovibrio inopinatus TaxID=102109 RepID=UPI0003F699C4|nr:acylneuraminate cytidylyltransferase family protein [Desulfovibrio inopinatus]